MKFVLNNNSEVGYRKGGIRINTVVTGVDNFNGGISPPFKSLIDTGAEDTCVSKAVMQRISSRLDSQTSKITPIGHIMVRGLYGVEIPEPVYILPNFYLGDVWLTDVLVVAVETGNVQCIIGRSILHQCDMTITPGDNKILLEFNDSLKYNKETIKVITEYTQNGDGTFNVVKFNEVTPFREVNMPVV